MDASLDTNVIIHLYKANFQSVLYNRMQFGSIKIYEYRNKLLHILLNVHI